MTTIKISGNNFAKGVKYAKQQSGKFDPTTKTWILPDTAQVERMLGAAAAYGWVVVKATPVNEDEIDDPAYWAAHNG